MKDALNLIWIDLEMTGLSPENDRIIEIATVVTDKDLNVLGEGPVYAISQSQAMLDGMDEWNTRQHGKSGLTERVQQSSVIEEEAEAKTIEFLSEFLDPRQSPMCGNSICQDRRFLARYMPKLEAFFHYRNLDVSTLTELVKRWNPKASEGLVKSGQHLALADIHESIDELKHYRTHFLKLDS
jgi:oligoribonuclease